MSAISADTASPDWAVLTWCDLRSIYMQFPSQNGPCVISFPRDSIGLAKALDLLKTRHVTEGAGTPYSPPPAPLFHPKSSAAPSQRLSAREILRKRGIIP